MAIALGAWFNPYYEQWQQIQTKVPVHSKKIAEIERQQTKFEKRFKQMEKSQDSLQENQLLLICTSPNIGESWKQRKKCGEHGYPISDNDE